MQADASRPYTIHKGPRHPAHVSLAWHQASPADLSKRWTVKNVLPENGTAILASEWGFGKTYVALELARCLMLGDHFAGQRVKRTGGVLWLAAEGEGELEPRLDAMRAENLIPAGRPLPFTWTSSFPMLLEDKAEPRLLAIVEAARAEMGERFGVNLAAIILDTMSAGAGFKDENDAAECQRAMNVLRNLGRAGGCLALAIDHYGKSAESGVRGSSAKEGFADATLVLNGTRDLKTNEVRDRSLVKRKVRGGVQGVLAAFEIKGVHLGIDEDGDPVTSAVVDWKEMVQRGSTDGRKVRTPNLSLFSSTLDAVLEDYGSNVRPYGAEGPKVRAAAIDRHRAAYEERSPGDIDPQSAAKQYRRHLRIAADRQLVVTQTIHGVPMLWRA